MIESREAKFVSIINEVIEDLKSLTLSVDIAAQELNMFLQRHSELKTKKKKPLARQTRLPLNDSLYEKLKFHQGRAADYVNKTNYGRRLKWAWSGPTKALKQFCQEHGIKIHYSHAPFSKNYSGFYIKEIKNETASAQRTKQKGGKQAKAETPGKNPK